MTAIVKHVAARPPTAAWAGLVLPGLGHLLTGKPVIGIGLLLCDAVVVWAAVAGLPRLGEVFAAPWNAGGLDLLLRVGGPLAAGVGGAVAVGVGSRAADPIRPYATAAVNLAATGAAVYTGAVWAGVPTPWAALAAVVLGLAAGGGAVLANRSDALPPFAIATFLAFAAFTWLAHHTPPWDAILTPWIRNFPLHPAVAVLWLFGLAGIGWWRAYRLARPREVSEEEWNSNRAIFLRSMARHQTGLIGLFGVTLLVTFVVLTPLIAPFDPDAIDAGPVKAAPSLLHLMGTDMYGRDLFSRVLYGGRISLSIGFIAVGIAATIGTVLGATAAFAGGRIDSLIMWFVDMLLSLPRLILLLSITGLFRFTGTAGIYMIVVILGLTGWMGVCRIVRSQVLSLKQQDFTQAARALGFSSTRIVFRHLIPNALAPVIVYCSLAIGSTMIVEAGLSFLGLGVPPPTATWGTIIDDGKDLLRYQPWIAVFPGLCIVFAVMSFNLLGDGLRDALDPKLRGR